MTLQDYNAIKELIDGIVGIETKQGENLKIAIKNYFDTKPVSVKLVSPKTSYTQSFNSKNDSIDKRMNEAMERYTSKLREETQVLKRKGKFKGNCSITGG